MQTRTILAGWMGLIGQNLILVRVSAYAEGKESRFAVISE